MNRAESASMEHLLEASVLDTTTLWDQRCVSIFLAAHMDSCTADILAIGVHNAAAQQWVSVSSCTCVG